MVRGEILQFTWFKTKNTGPCFDDGDKVTIRRAARRIIIDADAQEIEIKLDGRPQWDRGGFASVL